jgi:hypothetical protein
MSDIVEQLRKIGRFGESYGWGRDTIWFHAADEIEKLRAALKTARNDALEEAARRLAELHRNHKYNPQTGEGSEHDAGYYRALSEGAAWIFALGEKE